MTLKKLPVKLIEFYRYFISPMLGSNCRYHPTCSEYAIQEFETENFFKATVKTVLRILRCNQLFKGGIDYPVVTKKFSVLKGKKLKVKYWLIPKGKDKYIVIKAYNE